VLKLRVLIRSRRDQRNFWLSFRQWLGRDDMEIEAIVAGLCGSEI
jgi:hypothetical protein